RRVARGAERGEPEGPDVEGVAVPDGSVLIAELRTGTDHVAGARQGRQIAAAGDVVVVQMGLDDVADPEVGFARGIEVGIDVPAWIDDRRQARRLVADERGQMAESLDPELADQHPRERSIREPGAADARLPASASRAECRGPWRAGGSGS